MTAMNQYLAEARMAELREVRLQRGLTSVGNLLAEAAQVLRGALTPTGGCGAGLGRELRQDMGLN